MVHVDDRRHTESKYLCAPYCACCSRSFCDILVSKARFDPFSQHTRGRKMKIMVILATLMEEILETKVIRRLCLYCQHASITRTSRNIIGLPIAKVGSSIFKREATIINNKIFNLCSDIIAVCLGTLHVHALDKACRYQQQLVGLG